jgi:thiamine monophosphate synthase
LHLPLPEALKNKTAKAGVNIFVNARTDVYLADGGGGASLGQPEHAIALLAAHVLRLGKVQDSRVNKPDFLT